MTEMLTGQAACSTVGFMIWLWEAAVCSEIAARLCRLQLRFSSQAALALAMALDIHFFDSWQ